jgi:hypothetical protein
MTPIVVFPVCPKDLSLAVAHSRWLAKMNRKNSARAIVYAEDGCRQSDVLTLCSNLNTTFQHVAKRGYPKMPRHGWPKTPNMVFQMVARAMQKQCLPWLWFEADAVALRPDWVDALFAEYASAGKPCMAPKVDKMAHFNGTAIYPPETPELIPSAMLATDQAWDYMAAADMAPITHDASRSSMLHVWTIQSGRFSPVGGGSDPAQITLEMARRDIPKGMCMVHRIKDDSLIRLLMSGQFQP